VVKLMLEGWGVGGGLQRSRSDDLEPGHGSDDLSDTWAEASPYGSLIVQYAIDGKQPSATLIERAPDRGKEKV
jgi:hypothetical protein